MDKRNQGRISNRSFRIARGRRKWFKPLILLVLCAFAIFLADLFWIPPISVQGSGITAAQAATISPTPSAPAEPTRTPLPPEFIANGRQTIGITFAGSILVLIVVIGVIVFMPQKLDE